MSEQQQTEEKGGINWGGVAFGAAAGAGAGTVAFNNQANKLVQAAKTATEFTADAKTGIKSEAFVSTVKAGLTGENAVLQRAADALKDPNNIAGITSGTVKKSTKGFALQFSNGQAGATLKAAKLTGDVKKVLGDAKEATLPGDVLKKITDGGDKSWVAKMAGKQEKTVNDAIRKTDAFKKIGGSFKHMDNKSKALVGGVIVATAIVGTVVFNMVFGKKDKSHTAEVDTNRQAASITR